MLRIYRIAEKGILEKFRKRELNVHFVFERFVTRFARQTCVFDNIDESTSLIQSREMGIKAIYTS